MNPRKKGRIIFGKQGLLTSYECSCGGYVEPSEWGAMCYTCGASSPWPRYGRNPLRFPERQALMSVAQDLRKKGAQVTMANPSLTVKEFYVGMGRAGDWKTRAKIEKAVMVEGKLHWSDLMDDRACKIIAEAKANPTAIYGRSSPKEPYKLATIMLEEEAAKTHARELKKAGIFTDVVPVRFQTAGRMPAEIASFANPSGKKRIRILGWRTPWTPPDAIFGMTMPKWGWISKSDVPRSALVVYVFDMDAPKTRIMEISRQSLAQYQLV